MTMAFDKFDEPSSYVSAKASNRRRWFALLVVRASRLKPPASKSSRNPIADPVSNYPAGAEDNYYAAIKDPI